MSRNTNTMSSSLEKYHFCVIGHDMFCKPFLEANMGRIRLPNMQMYSVLSPILRAKLEEMLKATEKSQLNGIMNMMKMWIYNNAII